MFKRAWLIAAAAGTGCGGQLVDSFDACDVVATLAPEAAAPGSSVVLLGGPLTAVYDTLVQVDGAPAEISEITRSAGCTDCDVCRAEHLSCGGCTDRCGACVETLTFVAPPLAPGSRPVVLTNAYGSTPPIPFEILAPPPPTDTSTP